jgi:hypothetical protein
MVHVVSADHGKTFSVPERIFKDNWVLRGCPHTGPSMTENEKGMHFAWYSGGSNKGSFYIQSTDHGDSFDQHDSISAKGMHPQIASLGGNKLVVAWDESVQVGENFNKKIGIQVRSRNGEKELNAYITSDNDYATYPVVSPLEDKSLVVAYTAKVGSKEYVKWQRVNLLN